MILREHPDGQILITQPDHAALAERIMEQWGTGLRDSPRRREILLAIEAHDNGWLEVDAAPIVDPGAGTVLDFVHVPDDIRRGVWPRSVGLLADRPYAAALVAQHAVHIFLRYRGDASWAPFFAQMEALRDEHLARVGGVTLETLIHDYAYLRLGDLLSLSFCNAWADALGQEHGYEIRSDGSRLTIHPGDPFAGREIPLSVPARLLPRQPFASADAARAAWDAAPRLAVTGVLAGAPVC
jgi:hypothetical protein